MTILKRIAFLAVTCLLLASCSPGDGSADSQPISGGLTLRVKSEPKQPQPHQETKLIVQVLAKDQPVTGAKVEMGIRHDADKQMERVKAKLSAMGDYMVKKTFHHPGVYHLTVSAGKGDISATASKDLIVE